MAKRKREAKAQAHASAQANVDAQVQAKAHAQATAQVQPHTPLPALASLVPALALLGLVVGAPANHGYAALYDAGRIVTALGLLLVLARRHQPHRIFATLGPWAMVALVFGAGALLGRHAWDFRVFEHIHQAEFGLPSELAFVALAIGLRHGHRLAIALGFGLGAVALFVPEPGLASTDSALLEAFTELTHLPLVLALIAALALGAWALVAPAMKRPPPTTRYLAPALAIAAALAAITSSNPLQALTIVALFAAIYVHADSVLADRKAPTPRTDRALLYTSLAVICVLWLLLKSQALIASNTDENIYFYMAKVLADGQWPYADYFFAHPPLHVVLPGLAFATFGYSLTFAKLFPMLATLFGGLAVWGIARRSLTPVAAPIAMVLYLFGSEVLKASSNMTGVNMTTMWLLLGVWQAFKGHPIRGGAFLGAAICTGFYAMAPALATIATGFFWHDDSRRHAGLRHGLGLLAGFVIVAGALNVVFYALGGDTFLEGVYAYHQVKAFEDIAMVEAFGGNPGFPASIVHNVGLMMGGADFTKEVFYHPHLWLAGLVTPLVVLASWISRGAPYRMLFPTRLFRSDVDGRAFTLWLIALALFIQYALFRELYSFYFVLIYPFLALCAAYVIVRAVALLAAIDQHRGIFVGALGLGALLALGSYALVAESNEVVFDDELEVVGARNDYVWTDPPVLGGLGGITKTLFWEGERLKAGDVPGYRHYLWSKKRGFSVLEEVAEHIRSRSAPDETIAGSSTLAPLVALYADRRLAANEIDTNSKRFTTGILDEAQYWNAICADGVRYLVGTQRSFFEPGKLDNTPLVRRAFVLDRTFEDRTLQYNAPFVITLYRRIDGAQCSWP